MKEGIGSRLYSSLGLRSGGETWRYAVVEVRKAGSTLARRTLRGRAVSTPPSSPDPAHLTSDRRGYGAAGSSPGTAVTLSSEQVFVPPAAGGDGSQATEGPV